MCKRGHEDGKDAPEKGCAQRSQWSHLECVRQPRDQPCLCPDQTSPLGINRPMFTRSGKRTHAHPPGPMDALRQALLPGASLWCGGMAHNRGGGCWGWGAWDPRALRSRRARARGASWDGARASRSGETRDSGGGRWVAHSQGRGAGGSSTHAGRPLPRLFSEVQRARDRGRAACPSLTTAQVHKQVVLSHLDLVDHLRDQVKGGLPVHLRGEGLVVVELLRVRHRVVVDLLQDVPQEPVGRPRVQLHGLRGALPLRTAGKRGASQMAARTAPHTWSLCVARVCARVRLRTCGCNGVHVSVCRCACMCERARECACMSVCVCVYVSVHEYTCLRVGTRTSLCECLPVSVRVSMHMSYLGVYVCIRECTCMPACVCEYSYIRLHARTCESTSVSVCMCILTCVHVRTSVCVRVSRHVCACSACTCDSVSLGACVSTGASEASSKACSAHSLTPPQTRGTMSPGTLEP